MFLLHGNADTELSFEMRYLNFNCMVFVVALNCIGKCYCGIYVYSFSWEFVGTYIVTSTVYSLGFSFQFVYQAQGILEFSKLIIYTFPFHRQKLLAAYILMARRKNPSPYDGSVGKFSVHGEFDIHHMRKHCFLI